MSFTDLPKVCFDDECLEECKCPNSRTPREQELDPDKRLENWDEWMVKRRSIHEKLNKNEKLKRRPGKLLQNTSEDKRELLEKKSVMEYTRIPYPHDHYRGNPAFWKMPTTLTKQECEPQVYYSQMTKPEQCEIPEIEYVKVPDVIKNEKEANCTRIVDTWDNIPYCIEQKSKLKDELEIVEPYRPDLASIAVVGHKIQAPNEKPTAFVSESTSCEPRKQSKRTDPRKSAILTINNTTIYTDSEGKIYIAIIFEDSRIGKISTSQLILKNTSRYALRFKLKLIPKPIPSVLIGLELEQHEAKVFYFNDQSQVVLPAEILKFPIWFKSDIYGPNSASYQLLIEPYLWDSESLSIVLNMSANVGHIGIQDDCYKIKQRLNNQAKQQIVHEVLKDIIKKVPPPFPAELKLYSYDKATIFEAVNSVYDPIHFRPRYLYDKYVVEELEKFYEDVKLDIHPDTWDYRIDTLRVVTGDREYADQEVLLQDEIETIKSKYEDAYLKRKQMMEVEMSYWTPKPKKGGAVLKKAVKAKPVKKPKAGKRRIAVVERERPPLPKSLMDALEDVIKKLKAPVAWQQEHNRRLKLGYTLFCAYIDKICESVIQMERYFGITRPLPRTMATCKVEKMRIYDEKYDDSVLTRSKFSEKSKIQYKKAPDWTWTLPMENYVSRYKAFVASSKGSKGVKSKPSKLAKPEAKVTPELSIEEVEEEQSLTDASITIKAEDVSHYNNNIYLIFYLNLEKLVDDMVAIFELEPRPMIPQSILSRIHNSQFDKLTPDSEVRIHVFDLKRVISDMLNWKGDDTKLLQEQKFVPKIVPDIGEEESSVWNILKPYYPKRVPMKPYMEGIYGVCTKQYPPSTASVNLSEMKIVEEVILERNVQTSICGSDTLDVREPPYDIFLRGDTCTCKSSESSADEDLNYYDSNPCLSIKSKSTESFSDV